MYNDNRDIKFHLSHPLMKRIVELKEHNYADAEKFDYAALDFEDAMDSYDKILGIVGDICENTIGPNAESVDIEGPKVVDGRVHYARGTQENHDTLKQAGLIGISLPRKYNGLNFPLTPYVMSGEMISRADAGFSNIWGLQDCAETIYEFANEDMRNKYLPRFNLGETAAMDLTEPDAGSDLQAVQLKAHYDEAKGTWLLNGVKRFITNGDAEISLVLARSEEGTSDARGLSLFIYDKADDAMVVRRIENKLGIKGSPTCELVFKDAPAELVGDRKLGLIKYVMSLMNGARLGVGGQSVGISEAAYREAVKYAKERAQFGKTIENFPAVYEMLANMRVKLHAERSLLYETSRYIDMYKGIEDLHRNGVKLEKELRTEMKKYRKLADIFTPLLKLVASEYSNQIAYDSLQIHGGTGFMKDFPIERIFRDARITTIYEGTSQLQVVAAIRGVSAGGYLACIREFEQEKIKPEYEFMRRSLRAMTLEYEEAVATVIDQKNPEYIDFHARRLVEMAGNIIMGYLLLKDTMRDEYYRSSAEIFIKKTVSENRERAHYISNFSVKDMELYKA